MQGSEVAAPLVSTFARDVFPESPQNVALEFSILRLSCWNKFLMHDASNIEKNKSAVIWYCSELVGVYGFYVNWATFVETCLDQPIMKENIWNYYRILSKGKMAAARSKSYVRKVNPWLGGGGWRDAPRSNLRRG
jgi:hypothetical protein